MKRIRIIAISDDLAHGFGWGNFKPFMKTGWLTWVESQKWESIKERGSLIVMPENNFYSIDFKVSAFKEVTTGEGPYLIEFN
mgnify:CR=1 FL=1|tara:strand:- start:5783 stop:6028 length:246 start_codon:yes stop_codon:yes gene_type:complete